MSSLTNAFETTVLQWLLTNGAATRPTAWHVALFTVAPTETGGGTEVTGGSYVRMAVTLSVAGNTASNAASVEWPAASAGWGTIVSAAIMDASTGGNMIAYGPLTASRTINSGDVFRMAANALTVTLD